MKFKYWHEFGYELNLQELSQHFRFNDAGGCGFDFDESFKENARRLADQLQCWRPKEVVETELKGLYASDFVRGYLQKGDIDTEILLGEFAGFRQERKDVQDYIDSEFEDRCRELLESLNSAPPIIKKELWSIDYVSIPYDNECIHLFESIEIPKDAGNFNYFFALWIKNNSHQAIDEFLKYQLETNFNRDLSDFAKFLNSMIADNDSLISEETSRFIMRWIQIAPALSLEGAKMSNQPDKKSRNNIDPLNLPDLLGDDWEKFKSGFIELIQKHEKAKSTTNVFQQVMYGMWKYRTMPDKRWTQVTHVATAFIQYFSEQLKVKKDRLKRDATRFEEVTNKTVTFKIEKPFDEFCSRFNNKV